MKAFPLTIGYRQRAIGAVIAAAALFLVAVSLAGAMLAEAVASRRDDLADARRAIARLDAGSVTRSDAILADGESRLLSVKNPREAQAALQGALKDVAQRHETSIESLQAMPGEKSGGMIITRLKLTATMGESRIGGFYAALLEHSPQIIPETIELRPEIGAAVSDPQRAERRLAVRLDVKAFARLSPSGKEVR